jgi:hypothetical protein
VNCLELQLQWRGTRIWFGHVPSDLNTHHLRAFYTSHVFNVTEYGQHLPPPLGLNWVMPGTMPAAFSFYKRIRTTYLSANSQSETSENRSIFVRVSADGHIR